MAGVTWGPWLGGAEFRVWTPPVAAHVTGRYTARDEEGLQRVQSLCTVCKALCKCAGICACPAEFHVECRTGNVLAHISRFAAVHIHRDPFAGQPSKAG